MSYITHKNVALRTLLATHMQSLATKEELTEATILTAIENGTMVLLGNPNHQNVRPILVGQPAHIKVNANIGTSPLTHCFETELRKLHIALDSGADTIMDLSIFGNTNEIRRTILSQCSAPVGTVPLYSVAQTILDAGEDVACISVDDLFSEIENQAKQGVDFMTVHCGLTKRGAEWAAHDHFGHSRSMGIVSRGGSILARWMLKNQCENPFLEHFDRLLDIVLAYNVTISLGDGLRPGAGLDAGDSAQWEEVITLGQLAIRAHEAGVQCMIEGPGHVPMNEVKAQIKSIKRVTYGTPLYVLGPLVTDIAPGYDHIAGAIGGALAVQAGADFLCYITPAEHLALPNENDVKQGIIASRIAAQVGECALRKTFSLRREQSMNIARHSLDWEGMANISLDPTTVRERRLPHKHEEACAMCGKFCAVKMIQNI